LNKGGSIEIGNHVWILQDSAVLKKSFIPNNTIVGTNSIVNKKFDKEYTMIAGSPAQVIREDINWSRKRPYEFTE
jgi:acetyltransferase-like isoleucine patch superfamily enzyme